MHFMHDRSLLPSNSTKFEWAAKRQSLSAESVDAAMHKKNTLIVWSKLLGKQDSASSVWNLLIIQNRSFAPQHLVLITGMDKVPCLCKTNFFYQTEPRRSPRTRGQAQCIHIVPLYNNASQWKRYHEEQYTAPLIRATVTLVELVAYMQMPE